MEEKNAGTKEAEKSEEKLPTPEPKKEDSGGSPEPVDYRAALEEERAKREKAEKDRDNYKKRAIINDRHSKGQRTEDDEIEPVADDEDEQADRIAGKVLQRLTPALVANTLDQEIARITSNPDKQALIRFHYENSLARSGLDANAVREDVRKAVALADAPRMAIERDEAIRAAADRKTPPLGGSGRGSEEEISKKPYGWSVQQVESMNKQHMLATGKPFTEAELKRSWDLAKTGRATAEIPR